MRSILFALTLLCSFLTVASPYDPLIDSAARSRGVDPIVLRTISAHESGKNPWTFNADGEPFRYQDKATAVRVLWSLTQVPWMVKFVSRDGETQRRFFASEYSARAWLRGSQRITTSKGSYTLALRNDDSKEVLKGEVRIRQLRLINTDIGIAQINYRWNGQGVATVQKWFDPAFNLDFAAKRMAMLKKKYGSDLAAVGYYHSATPKYRKIYMSYFMPKYIEEKRNATVSLAATN